MSQNVLFSIDSFTGRNYVPLSDIDEIQLDMFNQNNANVKAVVIKNVKHRVIDCNVEDSVVLKTIKKSSDWVCVSSRDLPGYVKRQVWRRDTKKKDEYAKFCEEHGLTPIDKLREKRDGNDL